MKKTFIYLSSILLFISLLSGCFGDSGNSTTTTDKKDDNITYIKSDFTHLFYHEHNKYSVLVKKNGKIKSVSFPSNRYVPVTIFTDVKEGESNWYETKYSYTKFSGYFDEENNFLHIHIKDSDSISGADWDKGKFGSGLTSKIQ